MTDENFEPTLAQIAILSRKFHTSSPNTMF